jgi:hypothetical protein
LIQTTQPTDWHHIWLVSKSVLEALYFLAGIGVFIAACYAVKQVRLASEQLKLTKDIATANSRRESVKLASEHCRYYADEVVPAHEALVKKYNEQHCTFLNPVAIQPGAPPAPAFIINNGDFAQVNYDMRRITPEEWGKVSVEVVRLSNKMESFSIPFAAGVADDAIGFQETAPAFINALSFVIPAVYYLRQTQGARYPSILRLFNIWHDRVIANALAQVMPGMQRMIDNANRNQIPPI